MIVKIALLGLVVAAAVPEAPRSFSWTGPDGRTGSAEVTRSTDPETGTVRHEGRITTRSGETWTGAAEGRCAEGACTREAVFTGPDGAVVTRSAEWRRNADGSLTGVVTWQVPASLAPMAERLIERGGRD